MLQALERFYILINDSDKQHQEVYRNSCTSLQECLESYLRDQRGILVWPLRADFSIFTLLEQEDILAKIFFLHYGVALHLLTHRWFTKGSGKRLVRALVQSLSTDKEPWVETIQWAKRSVGIEN